MERRLIFLTPREYVIFEWYVKNFCLDELIQYKVDFYLDGYGIVNPFVTVKMSLSDTKKIVAFLRYHGSPNECLAVKASFDRSLLIKLADKISLFINRKKVS